MEMTMNSVWIRKSGGGNTHLQLLRNLRCRALDGNILTIQPNEQCHSLPNTGGDILTLVRPVTF